MQNRSLKKNVLTFVNMQFKGRESQKISKNNSYQCKVMYLLGFLYRDLLGDSHFFFRRGFVYGRCNLSCADLTIEVKHMQLVLPSGVNNNIRGFWVIFLFLWSLWFLLSPNSFILLEKVKIKRDITKVMCKTQSRRWRRVWEKSWLASIKINVV